MFCAIICSDISLLGALRQEHTQIVSQISVTKKQMMAGQMREDREMSVQTSLLT